MIGKKILLAEDDLNLGYLLVDYLETEGISAKLCRDGLTAYKSFQDNNYDLCLLDIMMPHMDGFTLAEKIRKLNKRIPILFLTAKSMKEDKMKGYAIGADDFISKPFDEEELLCKIKAMLRRTHNGHDSLPVQFNIGDYLFDYNRQELSYGGESKRLTQKENEILRLLCIHKNKILRRDDAVEQIYGKADYFLGRSFDVFISRIRKLLKKDARISIENVFKVGFILNVQE